MEDVSKRLKEYDLEQGRPSQQQRQPQPKKRGRPLGSRTRGRIRQRIRKSAASHETLAQRAHTSQFLRGVDKKSDDWKTQRAALFRQAHVEFNQIRAAGGQAYQDLVEAGRRANERKAAGQTAPGQPPAKRRRLGDSAPSAATREELAIARLSHHRDRPPEVFPPGASDRDVRRAYARTRVARADHLKQTASRFHAWQREREQASVRMVDPGFSCDGASALPTFPNMDFIRWVPPARLMARRALSGKLGQEPLKSAQCRRKQLRTRRNGFRTDMLKLWKSRHEPIQHASLQPLRKSISTNKTLCATVGFCVCERPALQNLVRGFKRMTRRLLKKGSGPKRIYQLGRLVLQLKARGSPSPDVWLYIAWGNLRDHSFTFLEMAPDGRAERTAEAAVFSHLVPLRVACDADPVGLWQVLSILDVAQEYTCRLFQLVGDSTKCRSFVPGMELWASFLDITDAFQQQALARRRRIEGAAGGDGDGGDDEGGAPPGGQDLLPIQDGLVGGDVEHEEDEGDDPDAIVCPGGPADDPGDEANSDVSEVRSALAWADEELDASSSCPGSGIWDESEPQSDTDNEQGQGVPTTAAEAAVPVALGPNPDPEESDTTLAGGATRVLRHWPSEPRAMDHPHFEIPGGGTLTYDRTQGQLVMKCGVAAHGSRCVMKRTVVEADVTRTVLQRAQGRPLATLLAWAKAAVDNPAAYPDKPSHDKLKTQRKCAAMGFDARKEQRSWALCQPCCAPFLEAERKKREGEDDEPEGCC
eukprot:TRINITY_DN10468_c0_g1_i1.p1 TRINITY_DN10468_c0_g1~~TRINITY_DN10468_c0_g1_i1.p1  ORF type:complete len:758 (+),score=85.29 TRINITY_DN10468_c0_g1_i1:543-2816(+)